MTWRGSTWTSLNYCDTRATIAAATLTTFAHFKRMRKFNWPLLLIGILLGSLVTVLIFWILYATKTGFFTNCASSSRMCLFNDYDNNLNSQLDDKTAILRLNSTKDKVYWTRMPTESNCTPGVNAEVWLPFAPYCELNGNIKATLIDPTFTNFTAARQNGTAPYLLSNGATADLQRNCGLPPNNTYFSSKIITSS